MDKNVVRRHKEIFTIKKDELFSFVTTWVDLKCVTLSEKAGQRQILFCFAYV